MPPFRLFQHPPPFAEHVGNRLDIMGEKNTNADLRRTEMPQLDASLSLII
jgi:hypothetical protein